jgi:hypothetical protein
MDRDIAKTSGFLLRPICFANLYHLIPVNYFAKNDPVAPGLENRCDGGTPYWVSKEHSSMIQHEYAIALSIGVSIAAFFITITIASIVLEAWFMDAACSSLERLDAIDGQSEIWLKAESRSALRLAFLQYPVGSRVSTVGFAAVALRKLLQFHTRNWGSSDVRMSIQTPLFAGRAIIPSRNCGADAAVDFCTYSLWQTASLQTLRRTLNDH